MRRIRTKLDVDRENKRNQILIGVVMILLLVVAPLGYSLISGGGATAQSTIEEQGVEFADINGYWRTNINNEVFAFTNLPSEVSSTNITGNFQLSDYSNNVLYFVDGGQGISEILNNIDRYILRYQKACLSEEDCLEDAPIKDCSDNLIIFTQGNETQVHKNESCVYISGNELKGADAFLYKVLNIN